MSDQQAKLQEKAIAITQQLQRWAQREHLLQSGEQIVFTLSIRSMPTVVRAVDDLLDMRPIDFFTKQRFRDAGVPLEGFFIRIENLLYSSDHAWIIEKGNQPSSRYPNFSTMRHLVYPRDKPEDLPHAGVKTRAAIAKILAFNGLPTQAWDPKEG